MLKEYLKSEIGKKYYQFTTEEHINILSIYINYTRKAKTQNSEVSGRYKE